MTQGSLYTVSEAIDLTPELLMSALEGLGWTHRAELALRLGVSIRAVREAARLAHGAILSGNDGLRLTKDATEDEVNECCGRFASQVSEMSARIVRTRAVWETRLMKEGA